MKTFSDDEYAGAYVRFPVELADRLAVAAQNHLARQARYLDPSADPIAYVDEWLRSLEQARTMPTPSAEPGDLLVKLARNEFWSFTARGHWIELAPVYRMGDERAEQQTGREVYAETKEKLAGARARIEDELHESFSRPDPGVDPDLAGAAKAYEDLGVAELRDQLTRSVLLEEINRAGAAPWQGADGQQVRIPLILGPVVVGTPLPLSDAAKAAAHYDLEPGVPPRVVE